MREKMFIRALNNNCSCRMSGDDFKAGEVVKFVCDQRIPDDICWVDHTYDEDTGKTLEEATKEQVTSIIFNYSFGHLFKKEYRS